MLLAYVILGISTLEIQSPFTISNEKLTHNLLKFKEWFNPLSTTGLLTPFLIGPYHELFTCVANYDTAFKMLHTQTCT